MPDGLIFEAGNTTYSLEEQTKQLVATFDPKYTPSKDWKFEIVAIKDDNINDEWQIKDLTGRDSKTLDYEWIKLGKVKNGKLSKINIHLKRNPRKEPRHIRLKIISYSSNSSKILVRKTKNTQQGTNSRHLPPPSQNP